MSGFFPSGGSTSSTTTNNFTPQQLAMQSSLYGAAGDWFFGPGGNPYTGQFYPGGSSSGITYQPTSYDTGQYQTITLPNGQTVSPGNVTPNPSFDYQSGHGGATPTQPIADHSTSTAALDNIINGMSSGGGNPGFNAIPSDKPQFLPSGMMYNGITTASPSSPAKDTKERQVERTLPAGSTPKLSLNDATSWAGDVAQSAVSHTGDALQNPANYFFPNPSTAFVNEQAQNGLFGDGVQDIAGQANTYVQDLTGITPSGTASSGSTAGIPSSWTPPSNYDDRTAWMDIAKNRIAPIDPNVQSAWAMQEALANDPNSILNKALGMMGDTAMGTYLNNNPYLEGMYQNAADDIQNRVLGQFSTAGRTGSGASQELLGTSLGKTYNDLYGQNYQQERNRQMMALSALPQYSMLPSDLLGNVGNQKMMWNQQILDAPMTALGQFAGLTGNSFMPTGSTITQPYSNNMGTAMGTLAGLGASFMPGMQPYALPLVMSGSSVGSLFNR